MNKKLVILIGLKSCIYHSNPEPSMEALPCNV